MQSWTSRCHVTFTTSAHGSASWTRSHNMLSAWLNECYRSAHSWKRANSFDGTLSFRICSMSRRSTSSRKSRPASGYSTSASRHASLQTGRKQESASGYCRSIVVARRWNRSAATATDGVAIYKDRIIIPPALRHAVLAALHASPQGVSMMTARAETSIFWPGMTEDIAMVRNECEHCYHIPVAASRAAHPAHLARLLLLPFQAICSDFFSWRTGTAGACIRRQPRIHI